MRFALGEFKPIFEILGHYNFPCETQLILNKHHTCTWMQQGHDWHQHQSAPKAFPEIWCYKDKLQWPFMETQEVLARNMNSYFVSVKKKTKEVNISPSDLDTPAVPIITLAHASVHPQNPPCLMTEPAQLRGASVPECWQSSGTQTMAEEYPRQATNISMHNMMADVF